MKTLIRMTLILLGLTIIFSILDNSKQTKNISELQKQVKCLQRELVYVGDDFCMKVINFDFGSTSVKIKLK